MRLPGSGGACEIASNAHRTILIAPHSRRRFPEGVDFATSPGYVGGRENRARLGLRGGPEAVITDKVVMRFDEAGKLYVESVHPGVTERDVQEATGWEMQFAADVTTTAPPTDRVRNALDPTGIYTGTSE